MNDNDIVGYDDSPSMYELRPVCVDCGAGENLTPLYRGDEWGTDDAQVCCVRCGDALDLQVVPIR